MLLNRKKRLSVEGLEDRHMMTGDLLPFDSVIRIDHPDGTIEWIYEVPSVVGSDSQRPSMPLMQGLATRNE